MVVNFSGAAKGREEQKKGPVTAAYLKKEEVALLQLTTGARIG